MKTKSLSIFLLSIVLLNSSCATIFTGTKQKVTFKSNADGKVYQNLTEIGKTNQVIKIKRKDLVKLYTIKVDGCSDKQIELPLKVNPPFLLNIPLAIIPYGLTFSYLDLANHANIKTKKIIEVDFDCKTKK